MNAIMVHFNIPASFTYIGVQEVDAVQALAPVNSALDAAE